MSTGENFDTADGDPSKAFDRQAFFEQYHERQDKKPLSFETESDYWRNIRGMAAENRANTPAPRRSPQYYGRESRLAKPIVRTIASVAVIGGLYLGTAAITDANYGEERAAHYLEQTGYTGVRHTDTDYMFIQWRGCSETDSVLYEFTATAPNGTSTEMLVCKGLLKGATLRQGE